MYMQLGSGTKSRYLGQLHKKTELQLAPTGSLSCSNYWETSVSLLFWAKKRHPDTQELTTHIAGDVTYLEPFVKKSRDVGFSYSKGTNEFCRVPWLQTAPLTIQTCALWVSGEHRPPLVQTATRSRKPQTRGLPSHLLLQPGRVHLLLPS